MKKTAVFLTVLVGLGFAYWLTSNKSDCVPLNTGTILEKVDTCESSSTSGFQNSEQYFSKWSGKPKQALCKQYQAIVSINSKPVNEPQYELCDVDKPTMWHLTACPSNPEYQSGKCFYCKRDLTNGNNIYYQAAYLSDDCSNAEFIMTSDLFREITPDNTKGLFIKSSPRNSNSTKPLVIQPPISVVP